MTDSSKTEVAFYEVEPWEEAHLSSAPTDLGSYMNHGPLTPASEPKDAEIASVFLKSQVNEATLNSLPNVRLITTRSTGYDHIDIAACRDRGILVANVPAYGENTVAEHTFGLILSLSRKIHHAHVRTSHGDFNLEGLTGFDLHGKTLGVVGAGRIGLHVIRIAKGFAMDVVAFDPSTDQLLAEVLGFRYLSLGEVLGSADIVTLHAPYNSHTHHLIDGDSISLMRKGALLINTARGGLVNTEAVLYALDSGQLAGAGLDVIEGEELIAEERELLGTPGAEEKMKMVLLGHALLRRENVVVTPHIAFDSKEALVRILDTTIDNIRAYVRGEAINLVQSSADRLAPSPPKAA